MDFFASISVSNSKAESVRLTRPAHAGGAAPALQVIWVRRPAVHVCWVARTDSWRARLPKRGEMGPERGVPAGLAPCTGLNVKSSSEVPAAYTQRTEMSGWDACIKRAWHALCATVRPPICTA